MAEFIQGIGKGAVSLFHNVFPIFDHDKARTEAKNEGTLLSIGRQKIEDERKKLKEGDVESFKKKRVEWSFSKVPTTQKASENKVVINAITSAKIIENFETKKPELTSTTPVITEPTLLIVDLQEQIKCIKCSIKKLELNLKLTNEDGINDGELFTLLEEISELCSKKDGVGCEEDLQSFVDEIILKRDMNSISGLIKLASFMCPILAFANKSLVSNLGEKAIIEDQDAIRNAAGICCKIVGYVAETGSDYDGTGKLIENGAEAVGFIGASHEAGVIEGVVSFVGISKKEKTLEDKIKGSIRSVVRTTITNTIDKVFKTATKYQHFICMVFITLLSTHILLTMSINNDKDTTESYYSSFIDNAYKTTMSIGTGTMTGGKKAKPRAKRATKAVSKAIAKPAKPVANATKPTKPVANATKPAKPTKPVANATKPTNTTAAPKKKK